MKTTPRVHTTPASPVEVHTPGDATDRLLNEMFLSPRVIDENIFRRFGETLERVAREAAARVRDAGSVAREAGETAAEARSAVKELSPKVETALRLVATIDQRSGVVRELLAATEDAEAHRKKIAEGLKEAAEALLAESTKRAADAVKSMEGRLDALTAKIESSETRLSAALERAEAAEQRAAAAEARASEADTELKAVTARWKATSTQAIGQIQQRCAEATTSIDAVSNEVDTRLASVESRTLAIRETLEATLAEAGRAPAEAKKRLEAALADIRDHAGEITATVDAAVAGAQQTASDAEAVIARLHEIMGGDESLGDTLERIEQARAHADGVVEELRSLADQGEQARGILADALLEAVDQIDRLELQRTELVTRIRGGIDEAREHMPRVAEQLAALEHKRAELLGGVSTHIERVEQAGMWLGALIGRAEQAGTKLAEAIKPVQQSEPAPKAQPKPESGAEAPPQATAEAPPRRRISRVDRPTDGATDNAA